MKLYEVRVVDFFGVSLRYGSLDNQKYKDYVAILEAMIEMKSIFHFTVKEVEFEEEDNNE